MAGGGDAVARPENQGKLGNKELTDIPPEVCLGSKEGIGPIREQRGGLNLIAAAGLSLLYEREWLS